MSEHPRFIQQTPHHCTLEHQGRALDLRYEHEGLRSGWTVYDGARLIERCPDLMLARRAALALVDGAFQAA